MFESAAHWTAFFGIATILVIGFALDRRSDNRFKRYTSKIVKELHPNGGGSLRDVVDQLSAGQNELRVAMTSMFEASPEAMYVTNKHGVSIRVNAAYKKLMGLSDEDALTGDWLHLLTPTSRIRAGGRLQSIIDDPHDFDFDMDLLDGRILKVVGWPIGEGVTFTGYQGVVTEVVGPDT